MIAKYLSTAGAVRKIFVSAAGLLAVAVPIVFGLLNTTPGGAESLAGYTGDNPDLYTVTSLSPTQ
jgi:hypothetical protein